VRARTALLAAAALLAFAAADISSGAPSPTGPVATAKPSVSGTLAVGRRLTGFTGTWAGNGEIAYAFQWFRCDGLGAHCTSIHGATSATYMLVGRDAGRTIGLTVTANDSAGPASAYASLVGPIASNPPLLVATAQPLVEGSAVQGKAIGMTTGAWSPTPEKLTYGWLRCNTNGRACERIAGASGSAYTLGAPDVGHALVGLVQATFGTNSQVALSTATEVAIGADVAGPTLVAGPTVAGIPVVGRRLTATSGTWSGVGTLSYAYRWYRCDGSGSRCNVVRGASKATYTLAPRDAGKTVGLRVEATDPSGTAHAYASLLGPVDESQAKLVPTIQPFVSGDARAGQRLVVTTGTWKPAPGTYSYAWLRCNTNGRACAAIAGATGSTYLVTPEDAGHAVAALVSATWRGSRSSALSTTALVSR